MENALTVKDFFRRSDVTSKFHELLGKRAPAFITSVLQVVANNKLLSSADPTSIYQAAAVAATLDLPINNSLGFAHMVPYNVKQEDGTYKKVAQFQMGYKGLVQLAQRSGQFRSINVTDVRESEMTKFDRGTGEFSFDWIQNTETRENKPIIGFLAFFKLANGFEKSLFMTIAELRKHGTKYSKTFNNQNGLWSTDFEAMASKTVLKLLLSKYAPLSIEMQTAIVTDQALIKDQETLDVDYVDSDHESIAELDESQADKSQKVTDAAIGLLTNAKNQNNAKRSNSNINA